MNLGLGNSQKIYLGSQEVSKIYFQNIEFYSSITFPTSGLIAFYNFQNNILDSIGTILPLVVGSSCSFNYTTGVNGASSIQFNNFGSCGSSAGLMCPQNIWNLYSGDTKASYSFWFKFIQNIPNVNPINAGCGMTFFGNDFGQFGFGVAPTDGTNTGRPVVYISGQYPSKYTFASPIVVGQWYHLAGTYNNTTRNFRVYVNGSLVYNYTFPSPIFAPPQNFLGFGINASGGYTAGEYGIPIIMDSVGLWNRILTDQDVSVLYNNGSGLEL